MLTGPIVDREPTAVDTLAVAGQAKILVVEDEDSMREFLEILLRRNDYEVSVAAEGDQGVAQLDREAFDLVITDLRMPKVDGLRVLAETKQRHPATEVIMVTAFATADTAISAMKQGAYDYLTKPFKVDEILVTVERALEKRALVQTNRRLREQLSGRNKLEDIVGRSAAMQQVFELVKQIAPTKTSILIMGESGTGKELVARAIHNLGDRAEKPFVPINCGAIPETLIESELFGHKRGAFTGATEDREGLFAAAAGGTVFLDEIGELPTTTQVKLLRTLQERTVKPVGGTTEIPIDVRVVAATNRNLDDEVAAGRFRSDLFYRLNVIPLILPPLRERREDLPLLVDHFLGKYAALLGKRIVDVDAGALALLSEYHYPGNVRELENLIERAVTLATEERISPSAFPDLQRRGQQLREPLKKLPSDGLDIDAYIGGIERQLLEQALQRTEGNRTEAARLLGITLRSLRYRLAKFGM